MPGPLDDDTALDMLDAIERFRQRTGHSPSIVELAAELGVPRTTAAHRLNVLQARRLIHREPGMPRTLTLSALGADVLHQERP